MIQLTRTIPIPNINRLKVTRVDIDDEASTAIVTVEVLTVGALIAGTHSLTIRNGLNEQGEGTSTLIANPAPVRVGMMVLLSSADIALAYDNLFTAWKGGANKAARLKAVETQGITDGWLPAGAVS